MMHANENCKNLERHIDVDCWLEGGDPYLVSVFDPAVQPEPIVSEIHADPDDAMAAARYYAEVYGVARINDMTEAAQ